jgi:hypothetical protein
VGDGGAVLPARGAQAQDGDAPKASGRVKPTLPVRSGIRRYGPEIEFELRWVVSRSAAVFLGDMAWRPQRCRPTRLPHFVCAGRPGVRRAGCVWCWAGRGWSRGRDWIGQRPAAGGDAVGLSGPGATIEIGPQQREGADKHQVDGQRRPSRRSCSRVWVAPEMSTDTDCRLAR